MTGIPEPAGAYQQMQAALQEARHCLESGDVPIGALVVDEAGQVLGRGYNRREADQDPTAHAEILALRQAGQARGSWRLDDCTLVVTLEPCLMCAGALMLARIQRLIFGAWEEKTGAVASRYDVLREGGKRQWVQVYPGVLEAESVQLLQDFFGQRR